VPPAANRPSYTLGPAPPDRSPPSGFTLPLPHSDGAICSRHTSRPDLVRPRAYTTRTIPSSSCTAPCLLDPDRTTQLLYGSAPTRLGSDHPAHRTAPCLRDSDQTGSAQAQPKAWRHHTRAAQAPTNTANRQIVQARTLECRISRSTIYSLRGDPDKHFSRASTSPTTPGHRQAPRPRGASTSASPTLRASPDSHS
jgi:hypothetical protein